MHALTRRIHSPTAPRISRSDGFTYLGLIIFIAIIGITSAASLQVGSILERRAAEQELLAVGAEFLDALASYSAATPIGQAGSPATLEELLRDTRNPELRRHLRKLYVDPITGSDEWGTITAFGGIGIVGVYSLSENTPIKVGNFSAAFQSFQDRKSYRDWKFMAAVQPPAAAPVPASDPPP